MAFDTARSFTWMVRTIKADGTIRALLAGEGAYKRVVPRSLSINVKPAIAVSILSSGPPVGHYLHTGPEQWTATPAVLKTKIIYQGTNDTLITGIADRLDLILDGKLYQDVDDATVFHCVKRAEIPTEEHDGDVMYLHLDVLWNVMARKN